MSGLSIGEVARRAGVRASALRYYEKVGLIAPQPREGGRRRYDPGVFNTLAVIEIAKQAGFTIGETRLLLHGFGRDVAASRRWRALAERKEAEIDALMANARRMKRLLRAALGCRCVTLEECGRWLRSRASRPRRSS